MCRTVCVTWKQGNKTKLQQSRSVSSWLKKDDFIITRGSDTFAGTRSFIFSGRKQVWLWWLDWKFSIAPLKTGAFPVILVQTKCLISFCNFMFSLFTFLVCFFLICIGFLITWLVYWVWKVICKMQIAVFDRNFLSFKHQKHVAEVLGEKRWEIWNGSNNKLNPLGAKTGFCGHYVREVTYVGKRFICVS